MIHLYNDSNAVAKEITKRGSVLHRCASMPIKLALNGIEDSQGNRFMDLLQRLVPGLADSIQNESIFTSSKSQYSSYAGHYSYWKFFSDSYKFMDTELKVRLYSEIRIDASGANKGATVSHSYFKTVRNKAYTARAAALQKMLPTVFEAFYRFVPFSEHIDVNGFFDPVSYVPEMPDQYHLEYNNNAFEHYMNISEIYKELANKVF